MPDVTPAPSADAKVGSLLLRIANVVHVDEDSLFVSFENSNDVAEVRATIRPAAIEVDLLRVGDEVVIAECGELLLLWGRVTPLHSNGETRVPETLALNATKSLTLQVGDGSITIRADGKILIKGKELVSHAQNVNRVKGGAVAIN